MQEKLENLITIFQGVHLPSVAYGDGILLQPSYFTKASGRGVTAPPIEISSKSEKYLLRGGDVLFTAKGWEHTAFLYTSTSRPAIPSSAFIVMRSGENAALLPQYLVWLLNHPATQSRLSAVAKGTSMPSLSLQDVAAFFIPVPVLQIQQSIGRIAELQSRQEHLETSIKLASRQQLQRQLLNIATQAS